MLIRTVVVVVATVLSTCFAELNAQPAPGYRGVVWQPPAEFNVAAEDLRRIEATGFNAVRTGIIGDERLLVLADTLELSVFQDLPLSFLAAGRLADTLAYASALLETAILRSNEHRSARFFGLGHSIEITDASCDALRSLIERGRAAASSPVQFYYTTRLAGADVCNAVDFVLLDGRDRSEGRDGADLSRIAAEWQAQHDVSMGLSAVGSWVGGTAERGLIHPHSAEQQARFLEERLDELLRGDWAPAAFFVYRWRDGRAAAPSISRAAADPFFERYGLWSAEGVERPAYAVVRGMLTGEQHVFAFDAGTGAPQCHEHFGPFGVIAWRGRVLLIKTQQTRGVLLPLERIGQRECRPGIGAAKAKQQRILVVKRKAEVGGFQEAWIEDVVARAGGVA